MLTFQAFVHLFSTEFNPDRLPITGDTGLFDDLALDSFDAFRLLLFLEALADVPFPPNDVPPMFSVGHAFEYYMGLCRTVADE